MKRDPRYLMVKVKIEKGSYDNFAHIFRKDFPRTQLACFLGTNNNRMNRLVKNPRKLTIEEIDRIAAYFDVKAEILFDLINRQ